MARNETAAEYRRLRAAVESILASAIRGLHPTDKARARTQLNLDFIESFSKPEPKLLRAMLDDIALFEPSLRGVCRFERYVAKPKPKMPEELVPLAQRMNGARFSLFAIREPHENGGFWIEDLLNRTPPKWLMTKAAKRAIDADAAVGIRVFNVGPFWLTVGPSIFPDDFTVRLCLQMGSRVHDLPGRQPFAAYIYEHVLAGDGPPDPDLENLIEIVSELDAIFGSAPTRKV